MRTAHSRGTRIAGGIAVAAISALALTSCFGGPPSSDVTTIDDVKTATIQIQAQGTFIEPGTLEPVEYGSRGSGFFVTSDGIAITNNHVVTGAGTLKVWVGGDQSVEYGATVLGASECLDLAVIKVDGKDFPTLGWVEGDIPQALEVYSAGFPLGDPNFTLTKGIVSKADVPQEDSWASLDHVIEHDARIRGGNSGGPLVTEEGQVVGVNYAGNDELDYNFAIHRDQVLPVLDDLIAGKLVQSLGLNAQALSPDETGAPLGIWVSSVKAGGAGDKAGIEPGDVLIQLAGVTLASAGSLEEYCEVIRTQGNDATMDVTVYRPSEDAFYEGQFNGDELVLTQGGGGGTDPIDPVDVGDFVLVSDDSGAVQVSVPDTWAQVDGAPATDGGGNQFLQVVASPDLAGYGQSWNVPGVAVSASQALVGTDLDAALASFTSGAQADCTLDNTGDYDDGLYVGKFAYFVGCAGTNTDFVTVVANDASNTHFIVVSVQMVSEADKTVVLDEVLGTFIAGF